MATVTWRTGRARLLKLAAFLERLPVRKFNYQTWVGLDWKGNADLSCGTTACALGWATTLPSFQRLGLELTPYKDGPICLTGGQPILRREGKRSLGWVGIGREIFGLTKRETAFLFVPNSTLHDKFWPTKGPGEMAPPKEVADHIRTFIKFKAKVRRYGIENVYSYP